MNMTTEQWLASLRQEVEARSSSIHELLLLYVTVSCNNTILDELRNAKLTAPSILLARGASREFVDGYVHAVNDMMKMIHAMNGRYMEEFDNG